MIRITRLFARTGFVAVAMVIPLVLSTPAQAATKAQWNTLAQCESGGDWSINTGNGYYGGLQFSKTTWIEFGGGKYAATADKATRAQQIAIAEKVLRVQGWGAWPTCSKKVGLA